MLDRTLVPPAGEITFDGLPKVNQEFLRRDIPFFWINAGDQPVVRLQIVFQSGIWYEQKKAISWLCAKMLAEGTERKTSQEIIEGFERLGAFLEINPGFDDISISVYGLKRNFGEVISLLNEILNESTFPEKEFQILKSNRKDQIVLNNNKNNLYASKKLREAIYGPTYPYGQGLTSEDIDGVELSEVKEYFHKKLFAEPKIYLSGAVDDQLVRTLNEISFSQAEQKSPLSHEYFSSNKNIYVEREGSLQSSVRMAWLIPDQRHKDYFHYLIAMSFLGGYFGSRLMKNIREEKGYTYGIHAYPVHLKRSSFGMISTEVIAKHTLDTFDEVRFEIDRLLNEPIPNEELDTLTNYLAGSFLASINTPFQLMDKFKKIIEAGLDESYYERYFTVLNTISQDELKDAVAKYFKPEDSYSALVGLSS